MPYGGIAITAVVALLGVVLNFFVPQDAFETVLSVASVGIVVTWATIMLCQMRLKKLADRGLLERPSFRLFGAPYTNWVTLVFLAGVLALVFVDSPATLVATVIAVIGIVIGWYACRKRIAELAAEREGFTGTHPVDPAVPEGH